MTNQFSKLKDVIGGLTPTLLAIIIFALVVSWYLHKMSEPHVQEVLSLKGDMNRGQAIFEINCAECHGLQSNGSVISSLDNFHKYKSKIEVIYPVTRGKRLLCQNSNLALKKWRIYLVI